MSDIPAPSQTIDAPQDQEREHSFDGITEFDNRLPNWWLWTFYVTIIFSPFYWLVFHVFGLADLPNEEFQARLDEKAAAMVQSEVTDASLTELARNPAFVASGAAVFKTNCSLCHMENGGGNIGPNLTDRFWLHGGRPTDIYNTVVNGVIEKGMNPWGKPLGPKRCQQVTAFVMSMRNTNVAGGKAAQGEAYDGN